VLDRHPGLSNAELARRTGLAAQTISVILRALDEQGLIARGAVLRGRRGQPATPLHLRADGAYGIGAALCWSRQRVCISDFDGTVMAENETTHAYPEFDGAIEGITSSVETFVAGLPEEKRSRIAGIGLALPVNMGHYLTLLNAPADAIKAWGERDFCAELAEATGLDVWLLNYGTAASGAEARHGRNGDAKGFAYYFLGSLMMAGVVDGSGPLASGNMGEFLGGMLVPGPEGNSVRAGDIVSGRGIFTALREAGISETIAIGPDWDWRQYADIVEAWVETAAKALAHVIVNTRCSFDLTSVVIDGILPVDLLGLLIEKVTAELEQLPVLFGRLPSLRQGELGPRAAMVGASRLPLQQRFFNIDSGS
jgi:predicted NBD/HSP70 family sugar kinase